jgi:hypothetical protein
VIFGHLSAAGPSMHLQTGKVDDGSWRGWSGNHWAWQNDGSSSTTTGEVRGSGWGKFEDGWPERVALGGVRANAIPYAVGCARRVM